MYSGGTFQFYFSIEQLVFLFFVGWGRFQCKKINNKEYLLAAPLFIIKSKSNVTRATPQNTDGFGELNAIK